jgi:hypothetical protein
VTPSRGLAAGLTGLLLALALLAAFAVLMDQGQLTSLVAQAADSGTLHEYFHDARHLLGVPCH